MVVIIVSIFISIICYSPAFGQDIFADVYNIDNNTLYNEEITIPDELDDKFCEIVLKSDTITINYSTKNFVNVRKLPSIDSNIVMQIMKNTPVNVIATYNNWSCIILETGIGFVNNDYLNIYEVPSKQYTDDELYIMAHVLAGECQTYPVLEQLYVGSVVLNRVDDSRYPNTIEGVVFQRGQYACTWDGNYYREPTEANWRNARWLLENGSILPGNVVYQAGKIQGKGVYLQTEYHYYCY